MKKFFLTGALTTCLLLTGCGGDKSASDNKPETIQFTPKDVVGMKMEAINTMGDTAEADKNSLSKAAGNKVNWQTAKRISNQKDFLEYVRDCREDYETVIPIICTNGFQPNYHELVKYMTLWFVQWSYQNLDDGSTAVLLNIKDYPGERVAAAYLENDTSFLDDEEKKLYNEAVKIVNEAKNFSKDPLYQELYIHDAITSRVTYYTEDPQPTCARFQTALGGLLDGKANCQGYSDTFYMLGNMCGIDVGKCNGDAGGGHTWNTVNFGDRSYFVDVTWDDSPIKLGNEPCNYYIYFNVPTDVMGADHQWYPDYIPQNMQPSPDGRNFYHAKAYSGSNGKYFGAWSTTAEDALGHVAYRIANQGYKFSWIEAPYTERYTNADTAASYVFDRLNEYGWRGYVYLNVQWRGGKYMYFTVEALPNQ